MWRIPVSYTHLDVYKRQAYPVSPDVLDEVETLSGMKIRAVLAPEKELKQALKKAYGSAPEDVYKRQRQCCKR